MMNKTLLALALVCVSAGIVSAATDKVVCYWGTWSVYRWGNGKFTVDDIDPTLCTHLIYGFVGLLQDGNVRLLDSYLDVDVGNFAKFNGLREKNPNLKTLLAIGGWNEGSETYSAVAASPSLRATFISSALNLVQTYGFDGFDLDWEYPAQRGGAAADVQNYVSLIKEFRAAFDPHGYLLTAAVAASASSVDLSYDVPALSQYLDFINVMTYDLHGAWDETTGQNAPLYASATVDLSANQKLLNVDSCIKGWIARGADPQKLVMGMGVYGRTFTLSNANEHDLGDLISGGGSQGKYTGESGFVGYHEIIEMQNEGGWTTVWDEEQQVPYAYKGNQWVGYDNPRSIAIKVNYAKSLNLGGVMIWSIDTDDFKGLSGTRYAILTAIKQALGGSVVVDPQPEVTQAPVDPATDAPVDPATDAPVDPATDAPVDPATDAPVVQPTAAPEEPSSGELCTKQGFVRDADDCSIFYYCNPTSTGYQVITQSCANGLIYDIVKNICNYPAAVDNC